jgi:ferredoxin
MAAPINQRFPPPQFTETGHQMPHLTAPPPRAGALDYLDIAVLFACLALATWIVLRRRERREVVLLSLFSLLYFGFWRNGCVCAIGSIQNLTQALFDPGYALPLTVLVFGVLPLVFALFFGRVFCAAVCPHGAFQDVMLLRPVRLPVWLEHGLRLLAYLYLGLAVVFAATGGSYIICRYDPFVQIFRLTGSLTMILTGVIFLLMSTFVGRPYCRFLCPYGVLLGLAGSVSRWRARVTPDKCTLCRRCQDACPFNAINQVTPRSVPAEATPQERHTLLLRSALLPLIIAAGLWFGGLAGAALAREHRTVALAERVQLEASGAVTGTTDESAGFYAEGAPPEKLYAEAHALVARYVLAGRLCGAWIGLVVALKLITLAWRPRRPEFETDAVRCVACARCFDYCPQEQKRRQALRAKTGAVGKLGVLE